MVADPTPSVLSSGTSAVATTTVSFSAQTAGTLLVLSVTSSSTVNTSGAGRPESTGWTRGPGAVDWVEVTMWAKVSTGAETSVQYAIAGAAASAYNLVAYVGTFDASPIGSSTSLHTHGGGDTTPSTSTTAMTPAAGADWLVVADYGGSRLGASTFNAPASLTASYTLHTSSRVTSPDTYVNVQGSHVVTGGSTSGTPTATWVSSASCTYGQLWAFKIAAAAALTPPELIMPTRKAY